MNDLHRKMYMVTPDAGIIKVTSEEMQKQIMMNNRNRKTYIVVHDVDAEVVMALGAMRVTSEEMKKHKMFGYMRLKPGISLWYYDVDKDPDLFVKWPVIAFGIMPRQDYDYEFESADGVSLLDDDPYGAIAEREFDRHN
jgi:hypothetical protein